MKYDAEPREPETMRATFKTGDRIPPVHKPYKKSQCQWVTGIGWVLNPTRRKFD